VLVVGRSVGRSELIGCVLVGADGDSVMGTGV
jgi:hypothetical protein